MAFVTYTLTQSALDWRLAAINGSVPKGTSKAREADLSAPSAHVELSMSRVTRVMSLKSM